MFDTALGCVVSPEPAKQPAWLPAGPGRALPREAAPQGGPFEPAAGEWDKGNSKLATCLSLPSPMTPARVKLPAAMPPSRALHLHTEPGLLHSQRSQRSGGSTAVPALPNP